MTITTESLAPNRAGLDYCDRNTVGRLEDAAAEVVEVALAAWMARRAGEDFAAEAARMARYQQITTYAKMLAGKGGLSAAGWVAYAEALIRDYYAIHAENAARDGDEARADYWRDLAEAQERQIAMKLAPVQTW